MLTLARPLRWVGFLTLLAGLAQVGAARAGETADEAELHFELGAEAYQEGDYRGAVEHFLVSNRLSPNAHVTENIARSYERLGRYAEAYRYYQQALDAAPSEDIQMQLKSAIDGLAEWVTILDVATEPPGATLYVDRAELGSRGESPELLGLTPGRYRVLAMKSGYRPAEVQLEELFAGHKRQVFLKLEPLLGHIAVSGANLTSATASVDIDGKHLSCVAPCTLDVPPGALLVTLSRPGYRAVETVVDVLSERLHRLVLRLEASTGTVSVEADEAGARIDVDGRPAGFSPALLRLPVGEHQLRVSYPGSSPVERLVVIAEDQQQHISVELPRNDEVLAASRHVESMLDAPSSVTVIPGEELRLFAYPTAIEALRGSPGVYQRDDRAYPTLGIRGEGRLGGYGNRILVLQDDHAMNESWAGGSYLGYQLRTDLADVERIEVVRGPGSVLYGTNAFAGVVNIVTRQVGAQSGTELGASVAQEGVGRLRARQNLRLSQRTEFWASVAVGKSAGNRYFLDSGTPNLPYVTPPEADSLETGTAEAHFRHRALSVAAFGTTHEKGVPHGYYDSLPGDLRARQRDTRAYIEARFEPTATGPVQSLSRVHLDASVYHGAFPHPPSEAGVEHDTFDGGWVGAEQRFVYSPLSMLQLTAGGVGQFHGISHQTASDDDGTYLDEQREVLVGAGYGLAELDLPRLHLSAGARYDAYATNPKGALDNAQRTFGASLNPRVALIVKTYEGGTTKVMTGKAFRAPSTYELFYNDDGFTQVPSPELGPEEVWSVEVQHLHQFSRSLQASVGVYITRSTNLVTSAGSSMTGEPLHYVNSPVPLALAGAEVRLRRDWGQGWMAEVSYSRQSAAYLASASLLDLFRWNSSLEHQAVANVPGHLAAFKGAMPIVRKALTLGVRLTGESPRATWQESAADGAQSYTQPFFLCDLVLAGTHESSGLSYTVGVYNVFDSQYQLPVGSELTWATFPQQGRSFLADVGLRF